MTKASVVARFKDLFEGNEVGFYKHAKSQGKWQYWGVEGKPSATDVAKHLRGTEGLSVSPIRSDNTCLFAVIDCDWHKGGGEEVDLKFITETINAKELPLVACRSKGGGAHLFAFFVSPIEAASAQQLMNKFAAKLGLSGQFEVFPKQKKLLAGQKGNGISLPYYGGNKTNRYAISIDQTGKEEKLSVEAFLDLAESVSLRKEDVEELLYEEYGDAPPCLQHIIEHGIESGSRNEALYNLTIYMKRKYPDSFRDKLLDLNAVIFDRPLPAREARATIASASRKDYKYRCSESPCRDHCNLELCITREFGIDESDADQVGITEFFSGLKKFDTDPVQWEITVKGVRVQVKTGTLMDYRRLMEAVAEAATIVLPTMKNQEWLRILAELMAEAEHVEAPDEAKVGGLLMAKLGEFIRRAHVVRGETVEEKREGRKALLRGAPIVDVDGAGQLRVYFRGKDFIEFLKRSRQGTISSASVWMTVKENGVKSDRLRVGKSIVAVWSMPVEADEYNQFTLKIPRFEQEF